MLRYCDDGFQEIFRLPSKFPIAYKIKINIKIIEAIYKNGELFLEKIGRLLYF